MRLGLSKPQHLTMIIELPHPPSVNSYWRSTPKGVLISAKGRRYRADVLHACLTAKPRPVRILGPISMLIAWHPCDKRRRDIDNILKAPLDAMAHAGLYEDDSQIERLAVEKLEQVKNGKLVINIVRK